MSPPSSPRCRRRPAGRKAAQNDQEPRMTNASQSGRLRIGGAFEVNRLGFGAMRIVGKGVWGPPEDRAEAIRTLERLPALGVDFIDTADSYGPDFSEELIRQA